MALLTKVTLHLRLAVCLMVVNISACLAEQEALLSLQAVIANKGLGCDLILPENTLHFKPLSSSQLMGAVQTYQIKSFRFQLSCVNEHEAILPTLTIEGETPYAGDVEQAVFLSGMPNGIGFMVRQSADDKPISLTDFYEPTEAIGNSGKGKALKILNEDNLYHTDNVLWVGLVGPFQHDIIPGHFHASLTLNVAFE